jgi:hypothetical protein
MFCKAEAAVRRLAAQKINDCSAGLSAFAARVFARCGTAAPVDRRGTK